jgi:hypothetical protein
VLNVLLCNSRSILPKIDEARATCATLSPSIFACTESWLNSAHKDNLISIPGYSIYRQDRRNRVGGGAAVWCSSRLSQKRLTPPFAPPTSIECIWLHLPSLAIVLLCIYIPPNINVSEYNAIHTFIVNCCDYFAINFQEHNLLLCGDFNTFNTNALCTALGLCNVVDQPTCGNSFLDKILVSQNLKLSAYCLVGPPLSNSDHNTVFATFPSDYLLNNFTTVYKTVYDLRNRYTSAFVDSIANTNFSSIMDAKQSVSEKCKVFQNTIIDCFKNSIPAHSVPLSSTDKPWLTPYIKKLIHERWTAYRQRNFFRYNKLKRHSQNPNS